MGFPSKIDADWVDNLTDEEADKIHKKSWETDPEYRKMFEDDPDIPDPSIYAPKPPPEPPKGRTVGGTLKDVAISGAKSIISTGEMVPGLLDIPTGGRVSKAMEDHLGYDPQGTKDWLSSHYSDAQKRANQKLAEAEGFWGTVKTALQNPSTIGHAAVESLPLMFAGGAIGRGGVKVLNRYGPKIWVNASTKMKMALAAGAGEGAVISGLSASEIRQETEDGYLSLGQSAAAVASGLLGGAIGFAGGRVAQKLGIADPDTMLVGLSNDLRPQHIAKRIITGGITEGVFEELPQESQEAIWVNAALGRPLMEGVAESGAMGMLAGGLMGAGTQLKPGRQEQAPPDPRRRVLAEATHNPDNPSLAIGAATTGMTTVQASSVTRRLNDLEDPGAREKAVDEIEKALVKAAPTPEEGKRRAKAFAGYALGKIDAGEEIEIDADLVEYASLDPVAKNEYAKDTMLGAAEETIQTLEKKIGNLEKIKKPTPEMQANLEQFKADLDVAMQSYDALSAADPAQEAAEETATETDAKPDEKSDQAPAMEDSEAADLYTDEELDKVAGPDITPDDVQEFLSYGVTEEEVAAMDTETAKQTLFDLRTQAENLAIQEAEWGNRDAGVPETDEAGTRDQMAWKNRKTDIPETDEGANRDYYQIEQDIKGQREKAKVDNNLEKVTNDSDKVDNPPLKDTDSADMDEATLRQTLDGGQTVPESVLDNHPDLKKEYYDKVTNNELDMVLTGDGKIGFKEMDPGYIPQDVGKNKDGEKIFTRPVEPGKRYVDDSNGNQSGTTGTPEQLFKEGKTRFLTDEEIQKFTAESLQPGQTVTWKNKKGKEFTGTLNKQQGKNWHITLDNGNNSIMPGTQLSPVESEQKTHDDKDIEIDGDTVSVDMPAAEEKTLKPAEQKKYLMDEIDAAIKKAPDSKERPTSGGNDASMDFRYNKLNFGYITIEVPNDGEYNVLNTKTALAEFKKRAKRFPAKEFEQTNPMPKPAGTRPTNTRVTGFAGDYIREYAPKRSTKVPDPPARGGKYYQQDGWFSNGVTAVKATPKNLSKQYPKEAFPDGGLEKLINDGQTDNHEVTAVTELYESPDADIQTLKAVVFAEDAPPNKNTAVFDPRQLDLVFRFFPDAKMSIKFGESSAGEYGILFFKDKGQVVGVVQSHYTKRETDSHIKRALSEIQRKRDVEKEKQARPSETADPVADRLKRAKEELPTGYYIQRERGSDGSAVFSLMKDGRYVVNGLNHSVNGIDEAVRQAKSRVKKTEPVTPASVAYGHLKAGKGFKNITEARKVIGEATGQEIKPGTTEAKQMDEVIEVVAVRVAREIVAEGKSPQETFDALVDLQDRMPNLSVRTSTSMRNQAYSTPLPLAYVASLRAGITGKTSVFEPSAGNGALLIGANPKKVIANEIDPSRVLNLQYQGFGKVMQEDGSAFTVSMMDDRVDVVVGNPPFGTVKDDRGNSRRWTITHEYETTQIDHAMVFNALEQMKPDGRAVFIIGSVKDQNTEERARMNLYRNPTKVQFFKHLMDNYNVVDLFSVSGKLYSKQGAKWPVDVIVIDGSGKSAMTLPGAKPPPYISTLEQLKEKLDGTRTDSLDADGTRGPGDSTVPAGDSDTQGTGIGQNDVHEQLGVGTPVDGGTVREPGGSDGTSGVEAGEPGTASGGGGRGKSGTDVGSGHQPTDSGSTESVGDSGHGTQQAADGDKQRGGKTDTGKGQQHLGGQSPVSIDQELANTSEADLDAMLDEAFGEDITVPQDISEELQNMSEDEIDSLIDDVFDAPAKTAKTKIPDEKPDRGRRSTDVGLQSTRAKNEEAIERYLKNWARREARKNKPPKRPPKNPPKDPKDNLEDIALESLEGVKDAVSGLSALFTPRNTLSSGFIFNEETYKAAKPYFVSAWNHAKAAGHSLKQLIQHLATQFGAEIKPYLKRFFVDQTAAEKNKDKKPPEPKEEKADPETQVAYTPASKSTAIGTLMPKNMAESINTALKAVQDQHGDIDKYVADQLGYTVEEVVGTKGKFGYFSAEQVDAIALAMNNISVGSGFIIGDQTGVGKGRVVAAMIRYAMRNDMVPVFVTHKAYLYSDMYRDLSDIGMADIADRILMTNSNEKIPLTADGEKILSTKATHLQNLRRMTSEGEISKDYDVVFTTYDQMNTTGSARRVFMETITRGRGMLIMDEAHNAGGTAGDRVNPQTGQVPRSIWFRELIQNAHSTFYSSATYAKRPDTMSLYSRTDMRLAVDDINDLAHAIGQGGVPLQQVTATMLAEAGQYIRRERSFDGVDYNTETVEVDQVKAAAMSVAFADIKKFSDEYIGGAMQDIEDGGAAGGTSVSGSSSASDRNISTTGFTSVMHNLIGQTLLALKVPAAVDLAIKQYQETGKKPIIALANTMGSFIEEHALENHLTPGDGIGLSFNHLIANYLDKTRRYKEGKKPNQVERYITDEQLGPEGVREFNRVKNMIYDLDFSGVPISPVDYALGKFKEAGISAGEITGRHHTIEYRKDGTTTYQRRGTKETSNKAKVDLMRDFNEDKVNAMVLNQSGSTGLSLHALPKWEGHDPAERVMILVQTEANIDTHMQMLGRVHRAGQVKTPTYIQLTGNIPTEMRGAAVLAGKMASLNANTTAAKGSKLEAEGVVDFINKYGNRVVANIMGDFPEIHEALGSPLPQKDSTASGLSELGAARKVTGRIPLLRTIKEQKDLYDMILSEYKDLIEQLDAMGQNDLEAKSFDTDARTLSRAVVFEGRGQSPFTREAVAEVVDMKKIGRSYTSQEVTNLLKQYVLGMDSTTAKNTDRTIQELMVDVEVAKEERYQDKMEAFRVFLNEQLEDIEDEDRRQATRVRLTTIADHWRFIHDVAIPGTVWEFPLGDTYFPMVVLNVQQKGSPKNPLALGTWRVTFAVPDSARRFEISFAAINNLVRTEQDLLDGNRGPATDADLARFDRARRTAREDRTIMTGNLLAAYARYSRGRIINFTDNNGKVRQGILMPQTFNTQEAFQAQRVVLDNPDNIMAVLNEGIAVKSRRGDLIAGNVRSRSGAIDPDTFSLSVPSSRVKGATYFLNQGLLDAIGRDREFVKRGNRMIATVPRSRIRGAFKHMLDNMNELFENASDNQRVRNVLGIEDLTVEQVGESATQTEDSQAQFSTNADYTPGQGLDLKDIQSRFKGQSLFLTKDGTIAIRMKNGMGLVVRMVNFGNGDTRMAMDMGRMKEGGVVLGKYENLEIQLNQDLADTLTRDHELWHFLEENLLTESERMVFRNKAKAYEAAGKFKFEWRSDMKENSANAFAQFLQERELHRGTALGRVIQKILDFIDGLRHIAQMSERKLAREVEGGQMFSRQPVHGQSGQTSFAAAPGRDSAAFKKWFKNSKVVDENGEPMVVYHGTMRDFNIFGSGREGQISTNIGTHFAKDPTVTDAFTMGNYTLPSSHSVDTWNPENSWYRDKDGNVRFDGVVVVQNQMENKVEVHNVEKHGPLSNLKSHWAPRVAAPGGRVHPTYLSIQNPLVVDNDPSFSLDDYDVAKEIAKVVLPMDQALFVHLATRNLMLSEEQAAKVWSAFKDGDPVTSPAASSLAEIMGGKDGLKYHTWEEYISANNGIMNHAPRERVVQLLTRAGYDGVVYNNTSRNEVMPGADPKAYIILEPTQAKSVYNRGAWDGTNPDPRYNTQEDRLAYDDALFANKYVSRRVGRKLTEKEKEVGRLAYGIKGLNPDHVKKAAQEMADKIPGDKSKAILVPIPGHTGDTAANVAIAEQIAKITGAKIQDILVREAGPSQRDLRVSRKKTQSPKEIVTAAGEKISRTEDVYFIDNVITSGATIRAARDAVGGGRGLVYAKSFSKGPKYTFAGPEALGADKGMAFEAQQMRDAGKSRKAVWEKTGWWEIIPGSDVWSWEIDDSKANVNLDALQSLPGRLDLATQYLRDQGHITGKQDIGSPAATEPLRKKALAWADEQIKSGEAASIPLDQVLDHPELHENYPFLKGIKVTRATSPEYAGVFDPDTNTIGVSGFIHEDPKQVFLHEIQHAIQDHEGFATGGNPDLFVNDPTFTPTPLSKRLAAAVRRHEEAGRGPDDYFKERGPDGEWITSVEDAKRFLKAVRSANAYNTYRLLTGEAQARLTERRMVLKGNKTRKAEPPWITLKGIMQEEGLLQEGQEPEDVLITRYVESVSASVVEDKNEIKRLESGKKIKVFRAMQVIDGELYPPMSAKVDGKLREPTKIGQWEKADENPELIKKGNKFKLDKANKSSIAAAYNPYFHTSASPLNDQFSSAYKRPNLVTVEVEIPASELTSGYKAEGAKDSVGEKKWHSGPVSSKLSAGKKRTVILSRYAKVLRIVPDSEVAGTIANLLEGENVTIPEKVVTLSLRAELEKRGVPIAGAQYSTSSDRKDPMSVLPEPARVRMKKARGVDHTSFIDEAKNWFQKVKEQTAHFPELTRVQDKSKRAIFKEMLRQHQEIPTISQDKAARAIHGFVSGMTKQEYDLYSLRLILGDEIANLNDGARTEKNLPFGFKSANEIRESYRKINQMVEASPKVKKALDARQEYQHQVARRLVEHGILNKDVLKKKEYFHHQVLQYWNLKERALKGLGTGSKDARSHWRPWMTKRKDSPLDYNTEYVEAELMALAQMIAQADTADSLRKIRAEADILPELKQAAKQVNTQMIDAIYYKLAKQGKWEVTKDGEPVDPLLPFKQKIAIGFSQLEKLAKDNSLTYDPGFEHLVDALAKGNTSHPQIWQFLSNQIQKEHSGSMQAAMIYKNIKARDQFIKDTLGDRFKTAENMVPDGYVAWEPKKNTGWFKVNTIADQTLEKVLSGEKALQDPDVKQILAKGRPQYWVIPEGLADTMDNFRPVPSDFALGRLSGRIMTGWKQYILLNPLSVMKYNINNMSGDLDATLAFDPKIATYSRQAFKDIRKWMKYGKNEELDIARDKGVIGSGFAVQEVEDTIQMLGVNRVVDEVMLEKNPKLVSKYWATVKGWSTWRENTLRLAAYRYFKDQHKKGVYETFGASKPSEIRALVDSGRADDAAAKMARELLGDYGAISRHGEMLRKHLIPFWSWMEINLPRYVYLLRNLKHEGGTAGTGTRAAGVLAKRGSMFALKASLLYGAISLWNLTMFPDEDDDLGEAKRGQLQLILGRTKDGSIRTLRVEGALSDALSWFGMEDLPGDVKDVYQGQANLTDKGVDMGKALVNRFAQGLRPDAKTMAEVAAGRKFYPDVFSPRPIRDTVEHVLGTVKMQMPYQWMTGKPKKGSTASEHLVNDLLQMFTYTTEAGVQAYYDTRSQVYDWKDKNGQESGGGQPTSRGNALYYYKQAMKYGDLEAADRYIRKYAELGGTYQGLKQSIRMAHPLSGIKKQDRARFLSELTPAQRDRLNQAIQWYQSTYLGRKS